MAKITFFSVLKSNLKCAFCKNKKCSVRYMPQRKKFHGVRCIAMCEKDKKAQEDALFKEKLP